MKDEQNWAAIIHISAFSGLIIPFGNIIIPLFLWLIKKNDSPFIDFHGKEAVNFQISVTVYFALAYVLLFVLIGIPLLLVVFLLSFIFPIIAAIKAVEGRYYFYHVSIKFIK
jgi:uncharacterized Tic20 family protein